MELRLTHGRDNPSKDMDEWGYEGPTLVDVDSVHQIYADMMTVRFNSPRARDAARTQTGWPIWDETTLEMLRRDDLIETQEQGAPPRFYGDMFFYERNSADELADINFLVKRARNNLQKALDSLPRMF